MRFMGLGGFELVIILVVVLLIFGPKNLPKLGSAIGRTVKSLRDGMGDKEDKGANGDDADQEQAQQTQAEVYDYDAEVKAAQTGADAAQTERPDKTE